MEEMEENGLQLSLQVHYSLTYQEYSLHLGFSILVIGLPLFDWYHIFSSSTYVCFDEVGLDTNKQLLIFLLATFDASACAFGIHRHPITTICQLNCLCTTVVGQSTGLLSVYVLSWSVCKSTTSFKARIAWLHSS